jgi:hypothetical protein
MQTRLWKRVKFWLRNVVNKMWKISCILAQKLSGANVVRLYKNIQNFTDQNLVCSWNQISD